MLVVPIQIVVAIVASTAEPPCLSICIPIWEQMPFSEETTPCFALTSSFLEALQNNTEF